MTTHSTSFMVNCLYSGEE